MAQGSAALRVHGKPPPSNFPCATGRLALVPGAPGRGKVGSQQIVAENHGPKDYQGSCTSSDADAAHMALGCAHSPWSVCIDVGPGC